MPIPCKVRRYCPVAIPSRCQTRGARSLAPPPPTGCVALRFSMVGTNTTRHDTTRHDTIHPSIVLLFFPLAKINNSITLYQKGHSGLHIARILPHARASLVVVVVVTIPVETLPGDKDISGVFVDHKGPRHRPDIGVPVFVVGVEQLGVVRVAFSFVIGLGTATKVAFVPIESIPCLEDGFERKRAIGIDGVAVEIAGVRKPGPNNLPIASLVVYVVFFSVIGVQIIVAVVWFFLVIILVIVIIGVLGYSQR
mmetsp:Transcript_10975/g.22161  ORF Transcript_10975/g.22161 Transcript_10975/m.22161 type:complete len:252 (-) Transcript_10975:520-1275(-)